MGGGGGGGGRRRFPNLNTFAHLIVLISIGYMMIVQNFAYLSISYLFVRED